jgi:Tfp pilus assembly protein PilF
MKALEIPPGGVSLDWAGADAAYARAFASRVLDLTGPGAAAAAERIGRSAVKGRVVTALDAWAGVRRRAGAEGWQGLLAAAGRADDSGDEARRGLREAALRSDAGRLKELAADSGVADLPGADAMLLADALRAEGEGEAAVRVLRAAQGRNPGDFWLNVLLEYTLGRSSAASREEEIGFLRAAVAARPHAAAARINLGNLLKDQGRPAEADREYREALRIKPDFSQAHYNLGNLLKEQDRAEEAEREYREALRLKPDLAEAHNNLGALLEAQGRAAEAEREVREALRLKPDLPEAHYNLGTLLEAQGRAAEAEREVREALRLRPDDSEAHCTLGGLLRDQGRFREALDELRRGHELGSRDPRWRYPSAAWVRDCQRLVELDTVLPAVLRGAAEPADAGAALGFVRICQYTKRNAEAARLSAAAMDAAPEAANEPRTAVRYNAACSAALAGCGRGIDAPAGEAERARLRGQALAWLRADLVLWGKGGGGDPNALAAAQRNLGHWREAPDLAGVRDADALDQLPEAERADWRKLWADVDALLQKAAPQK